MNCLTCQTPLLPGAASPYCSARCAGGRARKPAGRPKGRVEVTKKIPAPVLALWKVRTCLYCERQFRTGNTDHKDVNNPYCSLSCLAATRAGVDDDDSYAKEKAERERKERQPTAVGTCWRCSRRLQDGVCYRCHA